MIDARRAIVRALGAALLVACAPSVAPKYARARAAAERAYAAGRYLEAADAWQRAADAATRQRDRDEAHYRKAASLNRAGESEAAATEYRALARNEKTERAARSLFDLAEIARDDGDAAAAAARLDELLRRYPESGLAPRALSLRVEEVRSHGGESDVQRFLNQLLQRGTHPELEQFVHYAYAESLERQGDSVAALDRYLLVAARFAYPTGSLWDDALWHAADIEAKRNRPTRAIELLRRMLKERESSLGVGSYERPRYADAQYRIAELYRDALHDPEEARVEFRRLFSEHPQSRLRDDAKWQEALIAYRQGDGASACSAAKDLIGSVPDSRYAPCAALVCSSLTSNVNSRRCHDYIRREVVAGSSNGKAEADSR